MPVRRILGPVDSATPIFGSFFWNSINRADLPNSFYEGFDSLFPAFFACIPGGALCDAEIGPIFALLRNRIPSEHNRIVDDSRGFAAPLPISGGRSEAKEPRFGVCPAAASNPLGDGFVDGGKVPIFVTWNTVIG